MKVWNNNVGRQVNKGTNGLAVLELDNPYPTYTHLFELKNTNGSYASYKKVLDYKWEVKEEDKQQVLKNLNKTLGKDYESLKVYLNSRVSNFILNNYDNYFKRFNMSEDEQIQAYHISSSSAEYMLFKKCNMEVDLPNNIDFDIIKDIKIFSKIGSLATDISREVFKELFIQVKKFEKEKERKGELENGQEVNTSNAQGNSRGQNEDRNNANWLGDRILRGRGNRTMVSDIRAGGGNRAEPSALWNDVERVPNGEKTTRDNNASNDRGTEQENARDTRNGRELQGENSETTTRRTTNATIR